MTQLHRPTKHKKWRAASLRGRAGLKILVLALSGIGDTLIATPFLRALRQMYPQARLDAFVLWAGSKGLLESNPHLNTVHQKNLIQAGAWGALPFLLHLRRQHYDVTINVHTQGRRQYRAVARFLGAPLRLSHQYEGHNWLDRCLVNRTLPQDYTVHSVENNHRLLGLLDESTPPLGDAEYELSLSEEDRSWAQSYVARSSLESQPCLGIHVGSGGTKNLALKRWPLAHYKVLISKLARTHPSLAILLMGGPEEAQAHRQLQDASAHPRLHVPQTGNLRQAAALMAHLAGFLSVDTALMHLAAAMKVPNQMVIEAPTLNATNLPWRNPCFLIRNPVVNGRNLDYYRYDGKPIRGTDEELKQCMASVTVDAVHQQICALLPPD